MGSVCQPARARLRFEERVTRQERVLARIRNESMEVLLENEKLAEEINRLTQSIALESPKSVASSECTSEPSLITLSNSHPHQPETITTTSSTVHALPASLNPLFRSGLSFTTDGDQQTSSSSVAQQ